MEEHSLLLDRHQALVEPGSLRRLSLIANLDQILSSKNMFICLVFWFYSSNLIVIWKLLWIIWQAARKFSSTELWYLGNMFQENIMTLDDMEIWIWEVNPLTKLLLDHVSRFSMSNTCIKVILALIVLLAKYVGTQIKKYLKQKFTFLQVERAGRGTRLPQHQDAGSGRWCCQDSCSAGIPGQIRLDVNNATNTR